MITVFGRNYNIWSNEYSALFNGTTSYVILNDFNTGAGNPFAIVPIAGSASKWLVSMWVKMDNTTAFDGVVNLWTQGFLGNANSNTFRMSYIPNNSGGNPANRIFIDYRNNGTTNRVMRQWALQNNSSVTGATSISDLWVSGNTSINTNANGFVHLCVIVNLPSHPGALTSAATANIKCFWNGSELTTTANSVNLGETFTTDVTDSSDILGGNILDNPPSVQFEGKIDELAGMPTSEFASFRTAKSLTTDAQVATYLWNSGVPGDINSGAWGDFWWEFEQSWASSGGTTLNTLVPVSGSTFSTDHA
jgi:hypothetical protein